jgi:hypothetical protein
MPGQNTQFEACFDLMVKISRLYKRRCLDAQSNFLSDVRVATKNLERVTSSPLLRQRFRCIAIPENCLLSGKRSPK